MCVRVYVYIKRKENKPETKLKLEGSLNRGRVVVDRGEGRRVMMFLLSPLPIV